MLAGGAFMTVDGTAAGQSGETDSGVESAHIDPSALDKLLDPFASSDQPGFAVGVALKGVPEYRRCAGVASVELPVQLSPTIRMRIGSTTKQFCALAIMLLAEDGSLSIDDTPRQHIPELPEWAETFTIRHLLSHTSGMRDSFDLLFQTCGPGIITSPEMPLQILFDVDSVNFPPGTSWRYNNAGYVVLSEIVERVGGQPFADFLKTRIFEPIGMDATVLRPVDTDMVPNSASLHVPLPTGGWSRGVFGVPLRGEGGIVSTVDDMLGWLSHMAHPTVGSHTSWEQMRASYATHGYGFGLMIQKHRGLDIVHHPGAVAGGSSQALKVLGHDLDIVVLNNNGLNVMAMYQLVDAIIDACIPGLPPAPENTPGMPVTGTFYSRETGRVISLLAHKGQQLMVLSGMMLPTGRDRDGALSVPFLPTDLRVRPGADGTRLELMEYGSADTLEKIEPSEGESLDDLVGSYRSGPAGILAELSRSDQGYNLRFSNALGSLVYPLTPIGPRLWQMVSPVPMPLGGTLEIGTDEFLFSTMNTTRLRFVRI
jgi:CubicO group peptidase (beta-lactamase class C family)